MHTTALVQQVNAPWGLSRLSNGATPLANKDTNALDFQYTFDDSSGGGTDAFILDTGCRTSHREFAGRASCFPSDLPCVDGNGRGRRDSSLPRITFEEQLHNGHTPQRLQFPVAPAYATTFNSCQGLTLSRVAADLTSRTVNCIMLFLEFAIDLTP